MKPVDVEIRARVTYSVEHGTSPQSEALRVLRRFMCCQAGRDMVEYGLARPFGYTLAPLDKGGTADCDDLCTCGHERFTHMVKETEEGPCVIDGCDCQEFVLVEGPRWTLWRAENDSPDAWYVLTPVDRPHSGQRVEYVEVVPNRG